MKRILHMTPPDIHNGVHRYIFNHLPYMDMNQYEFAFLSKSAGEIRKTDEYKKYGFKLYTLHNTERDNKEGLRKEIEGILCEGYDAIHLHTSSWRGFFIEEVAMKMGVGQVIVHSHSTGIDEVDRQEREKRLQTHNWYKEKFTFEYATDLCACSRLAGDWLYGAQIPRERIKILPNAIDAEKYHFSFFKRKQMRAALHVENRIVIGNIGRYCYQKNQEFLLRVFARILKGNKRFFLLCIGHGETKLSLLKLAEQLGIREDILLLDWQEHIENYLQAMDVFCLPSHFEGLAISVVEAQAAGLQCFVADTVSKEIKLTDRVEFLPLDENVWCDKLRDIQEDGCRKQYGSQIAEQGYDLQTAAKKLMNLYEKRHV